MIQASLVFYACSRGFGTSISLLDNGRLHQIQTVSGASFSVASCTERLVDRHQRYHRFDHYISVKMLRCSDILASHPAETAQSSFLGDAGLVHYLGHPGCFHRNGQLRIEYTLARWRRSMPRLGMHHTH